MVLKREPKKHYVRLILARLMLDRAVRLKEEANLAGARKAGELGKRGDRILDEIDEHLSVVLKDDARNAKALEIRAKASEAAGREAAKPPESGE